LVTLTLPRSRHEDAACYDQRELDLPETGVPEPAQRLLRECVFTFEQLGALLYLHEHKGKGSTVPALVKVLRIPGSRHERRWIGWSPAVWFSRSPPLRRPSLTEPLPWNSKPASRRSFALASRIGWAFCS
jgi:hypothetical protein